MSTPHDQQPRTDKKDMSVEELRLLHEAPSHERTADAGFIQRHARAIGAWTTGVILGAGVVGGVARATGDNAPAERNDKQQAGTSQSAEPSDPTEPTHSEPADHEVGVAGTTFDTINVKLTPEMIEEAKQPVTVADYPTPEAALERFGQIENAFYLSATITNDGTSNFPETDESKDVALDILTNSFGNEATARDYYNMGSGELRHIIGQKLWYINENDVIENGKTATWHGIWSIDGVANDQGSGAYEALVDRTYETNFHEIDDAVYQNIPNIQSVMKVPTEITLHKENGVWHLDSLYSQE